MVAWAYFINWVFLVLYQLLNIYFYVVLIAVLMSWIEPNPYNPVVRFLHSVTDPLFDFFRDRIPLVFGGIDFSPMLVFLLIWFLQAVVLPALQFYLVPV